MKKGDLFTTNGDLFRTKCGLFATKGDAGKAMHMKRSSGGRAAGAMLCRPPVKRNLA